MLRKKVVDLFGWGLVLWLIGYLLGMIFFMFVPPSLIGWVITPIATVITLWVLFKRIKGKSFEHYMQIAIIWTLMAVLLDYLFIVKILKPVDGYYKMDVYLYYILTLVMPLMVGFFKLRRVAK